MSCSLVSDSLNVTTVSLLRDTGTFEDYLKGLDLIRQSITDKEQELNQALLGFYKSTNVDENLFNQYLISINKYLTSIIDNVDSNSIIINSETALLIRINNFAKLSDTKTESNDCSLIIENLTDYHENCKYTLEVLQIILDNFEKETLTRLKKLSNNDLSNLENSNQSIDYKLKINKYYVEMVEIINLFRMLIVSYKSNMNMELLTKSESVEKLTMNCDTNKLPLLLMVPDLSVKLIDIFNMGKMWLDGEEVFLYQIREEIRELKVQAKEKYLKIADEKQNHSRLIKEMKTSNLMVQNNKQKLNDIKTQLKQLNEQILLSKLEYERKINQKQHSKSMIEFLEISISQTKRNYNLQLKRQKLQREITDLENSLIKIQENTSEISTKIDTMSHTAEFVELKSKNDEKDFLKIKADLEMYSHNVLSLKKDLENLKKLLNIFQSIEILRTSPEYVENIFEEQSTKYVKLSPSLMEKINMKKQMLS